MQEIIEKYKTCNNCTWFVDEKTIGNYEHDLAVKNQRGFCLVKELYTMQKPDDEACSDFNFDGETKIAKMSEQSKVEENRNLIEDYFLFKFCQSDFYKSKFEEYLNEIKKKDLGVLKNYDYFFNQLGGNTIPSSEKS